MAVKTLSPDRQRQLTRMAAGNCYRCGWPRDCESKEHCTTCLTWERVRGRRRTGSEPWHRGGPGRPPIGAKA